LHVYFCPKTGFWSPTPYVVVVFVFNDLRQEEVVRFVDIGGIVDHDWINFLFIIVNELLSHTWPRMCSTCRKHFPVFSSFMTYHRVCNWSNTTGGTSGEGTAYTSGAPVFTPGIQWGSCYSIFSFMCNVLLIVVCPLSLFIWALCCLSFFDWRILITPFVSSNSIFLHYKW
jgi:hypothetical protein